MSTDYRRLYRSRDNRMIAGVAGGLGEFLNIDPTVIRLIFVFSLFLSGVGFLIYLVMLLVVPEEPEAAAALPTVQLNPVRESKPKTTHKKSS